VKLDSDDNLRRLVFIVTGLNTGGAEIMLLKLCSKLDRHRFVPTVISLSDKGVVGPRIEALGVPVYALGMRPGRPSLIGLFRLRKLISTIGPDLLQGWMYHGNLAASMVVSKGVVVWGIRQSLYSLDKERLLTRWVIRLGAVMSRLPRAIVYNSRTSSNQHERIKFDQSRTIVIPNGFDTDVFRPDVKARDDIRRELGLDDNAVLVGLIGRYHPQKDHGNFLNAAAILNKEFPDVHFLLAGNQVNSDNPVLGSLIVELGLGDRVLLLGERTDISQLNAALDIASSASAWGEGFANTIGEAMSCGVPCVVTDVGDSALIVGDMGRVVPPGDPGALAREWKSLILLSSEDRRLMAANVRKRIIENFSLASVVKQYEELYENLIAKEGI